MYPSILPCNVLPEGCLRRLEARTCAQLICFLTSRIEMESVAFAYYGDLLFSLLSRSFLVISCVRLSFFLWISAELHWISVRRPTWWGLRRVCVCLQVWIVPPVTLLSSGFSGWSPNSCRWYDTGYWWLGDYAGSSGWSSTRMSTPKENRTSVALRHQQICYCETVL